MGLTGSKTFFGFGFGPIQSGLFLREAYRSGNFNRLVVAEVLPDIVQSIRDANGYFSINITCEDYIENERIGPIEIYNPLVQEPDAEKLVEAIAHADEISTAVPSVYAYKSSGAESLHRMLAEGLLKKKKIRGPSCVVYTAENHNNAAQILENYISEYIQGPISEWGKPRVQFLNSVIGKMSRIVSDPEEIEHQDLKTVTAMSNRAFLVESFNEIFISKICMDASFKRGLDVFVEVEDLAPFEEAKLYGHNAVHALIGYVGKIIGAKRVADALNFPGFMAFVQDAFLHESGEALIRKHRGLDPLFTRDGFQAYAEDLLKRMANPFLGDRIERIIRDPERKLRWNGRLIGTMRLAVDKGVTPVRFALGSAAAVDHLSQQLQSKQQSFPGIIKENWERDVKDLGEAEEMIRLIENASQKLQKLKNCQRSDLDDFFVNY